MICIANKAVKLSYYHCIRGILYLGHFPSRVVLLATFCQILYRRETALSRPEIIEVTLLIEDHRPFYSPDTCRGEGAIKLILTWNVGVSKFSAGKVCRQVVCFSMASKFIDSFYFVGEKKVVVISFVEYYITYPSGMPFVSSEKTIA